MLSKVAWLVDACGRQKYKACSYHMHIHTHVVHSHGIMHNFPALKVSAVVVCKLVVVSVVLRAHLHLEKGWNQVLLCK